MDRVALALPSTHHVNRHLLRTPSQAISYPPHPLPSRERPRCIDGVPLLHAPRNTSRDGRSGRRGSRGGRCAAAQLLQARSSCQNQSGRCVQLSHEWCPQGPSPMSPNASARFITSFTWQRRPSIGCTRSVRTASRPCSTECRPCASPFSLTSRDR